MSIAFLRDAVAPAIHSETEGLLKLWREKIRLAQGKPFQGDQDLIRNMVDVIRNVVDVILLATLGVRTGLSKSQTELLSKIDKIDLLKANHSPAVFPTASESPAYSATRTLVDSIQIGMTSLIPRQHMNFALKFYPSLIAARKYTDKLMTDVLQAEWKKASENPDKP